ncbi:MAG: DegT/DnrJ/EryC1/StrS family aminotransferase [Candidatus Delongbacteria bacterium]|jgi:dTDP-4-amino-4,6-dideoxygalactose transaminase|nr:DegT/DnrJ/EryC1/StrS family aminotransferase [Candidatus Delongbacteria bacterium]
MQNEIGSEYWIIDPTDQHHSNVVPEWLKKWPNIVLTSSGRGAISLAIESVTDKIKSKTALLPAYCCHTMIDPFIKSGFEVFFYDIQKDGLLVDINSVEKYLNSNIGILLHMGYFGFDTNRNIEHLLAKFKNQGTSIIEDVTHTLFSDFSRNKNNDFFVASIRKWMGIPSGGFCASKVDIKVSTKSDEEFGNLRLKALKKKSEFIKTGDDNLKSKFLDLFRSAEAVLDKKPEPYQIDEISLSILNQTAVENLIAKRRENYTYLAQFLSKNIKLKLAFQELPENVCPLFLPLYVKGNRDELQRKLIENKIYAPVHWPRANHVNYSIYSGSNCILENIISIPIDQRYSLAEMDRIAYIIRDYK